MATKKILVVDDERDLRKTVVRILRPLGYQVAEADDVDSAMNAVAGEAFDLVITDQRMPLGGVDDAPGADPRAGIILVERVRGNGSNIPMILHTSEMDGEARELLHRGVIQGFIAKPADYTTIVDAVARALRANPGEVATGT